MSYEVYAEVFKTYRQQLVQTLPMKDTLFVTSLNGRDLLPGNTASEIEALSTRADKADYFCKNVIQISLDSKTDACITVFRNFLSLLKSSSYEHVKQLGIKMESDLGVGMPDGISHQESETSITEDTFMAIENATVYIESVQNILEGTLTAIENKNSITLVSQWAGIVIAVGGGMCWGVSIIPTSPGKNFLSSTVTGYVALYGVIMTLGSLAVGNYLINEEMKYAEKAIERYVNYRKAYLPIKAHQKFPLEYRKLGRNEIRKQVLPLLEREKKNLEQYLEQNKI